MATPDTASPRPRSRLGIPNATALLSTIILAPLVVTGAINLYQFRAAYRAKVVDHFELTVGSHAQTIDSFLNDRLGDIRIVAREHPMERLLDPKFLRRVLTLLREEYHGAFVDLGVVGSDGTQIAYAGPFNLAMADYSKAAWFAEAEREESYISDVFAGLRGTPHFIVATQRTDGDRSYLVKATIDFEAFNALVERIRVGRTGFAFIFNRRGEFQTKPRFEVSLDRPPYLDLLEGRAPSDQVTTLTGRDALGRQSMFTISPLNRGDWFLCYQQQRSDAYAELNQVELLAGTVFAIAFLPTIFVSYLLVRQLASRLAAGERQRSVMTEGVLEAGRLASIGELAAGIAHEINNPVAIMVEEAGWIDDLLHDGSPSSPDNLAEIQRAVAQIRNQGDRCKEITYKLLSFARKTDPTVRPVDLNGVVAEVLGLTSQKTRYANIHIVTELAQDLPPVSASPTELQQVLLNLVNNAIDAIGQRGGEVTVTTRHEHGQVMMSVRDTGQGIPKANQARIFDPFFTTKPVGQGTGLGLSICYGIVDKLGGRITVDSEVDQGTTFTVYLPTGEARERAPGDQAAPGSDLPRGGGPTS